MTTFVNKEMYFSFVRSLIFVIHSSVSNQLLVVFNEIKAVLRGTDKMSNMLRRTFLILKRQGFKLQFVIKHLRLCKSNFRNAVSSAVM